MADVTACPLETIRTFQIQTGSHLKITKCHINPFNLIFEAVLSDVLFFFLILLQQDQFKGCSKAEPSGTESIPFSSSNSQHMGGRAAYKKKKKTNKYPTMSNRVPKNPADLS